MKFNLKIAEFDVYFKVAINLKVLNSAFANGNKKYISGRKTTSKNYFKTIESIYGAGIFLK